LVLLSQEVLSVAAGSKRSFARTYNGDYFSGGFFYLGSTFNYLAQWREPDGIKANIVSFVPPLRFNHYEAAIDPLALILSNQIYVMLHLPDPAPVFDALRARIQEAVHGMTHAQKRLALARVEALRAYATAIETELLRGR